MQFKNSTHKGRFMRAIKPMDQKDKTQMAVAFLLTATKALWDRSRICMINNKILVHRIHLNHKTLRLERRKLLQEQDDKGVLAGLKELNAIFADIDKPKIEMDEDLFGRIVEKITVVDDTKIKFHLLGGLTLSEKIPQKRGGARE